jgi:transcription elongation factor GreB
LFFVFSEGITNDMSRGFVKEGDQEEPVVVPSRAALPPHVTNYVTPTGLYLLQTEKETLLQQLAALKSADERELRRKRTYYNGVIQKINERIASARVIDPLQQPQDEVRFGARVTYQMLPAPQENTLTIVGVDEADIKQGKIAFVAPLAQAITGAKVGETVPFRLGNDQRSILIKHIAYLPQA